MKILLILILMKIIWWFFIMIILLRLWCFICYSMWTVGFVETACVTESLIQKAALAGVDWAPACEQKSPWFDSQSGHVPGLRSRSPVGGMQEATTHWYFSPSLSPSFPPLSLKKKKSEDNNRTQFENDGRGRERAE